MMRRVATGLMLAVAALAGPVPVAMGQDRGLQRIVTMAGEEVVSYASSHALVIGVSRYSAGWNPLPGVREDVAAVTTALKAQGFEVEQVPLDLDKAALEAAIENFLQRHGYGTANERKRLLIYYAGHGETVKVHEVPLGFIVPSDAPRLDRQNPAAFQAKAISMSRILAWTEQVAARHLMFIFDSCFSGTLFNNLNRGPNQPPPAINRWMAKPVQHFITAGSADEIVPDRSAFRRKFVLGLDGAADFDNDGFISGTELGYFLQSQVPIDSPQTPQQGKARGVSDGEFLFVLHRPALPRITGPTARELRDACLAHASPDSEDRVGKGVAFYDLDGAAVVAACERALAANPDDAAIMTNMGRGKGRLMDFDGAMSWFRKAADRGDATAKNNIGSLYYNAWGVQRDYQEAMRWYRKAADKGHAPAMNNIGALYHNGWGVPKDLPQALSWYRQAVSAGETEHAAKNIKALCSSGYQPAC
ncbi:caspase family protein [Niveispirillum sp.]|uniref:caspase family protein n=1 Tax=Niveispirillum sp. TaxID=1917217 RepID=UPI001B624559|nr:caspase family protein [Niveispirillum sp.]MBP7338047.1 SEL1-like repeat protein [Niveispirillum sp.]